MSKHSEKIKELWNNAVSDYDTHMHNTGHYITQEKLLDILSEYLKSPILDLAGGPGFLAEKIFKKGFDVTINDFSSEMFKVFSERLKRYSNVEFLNQDAHAIKTSKLFNTILCCNLFYYLDDRNTTIQNWKKLLSQNGKIILFEEYPFQRPIGTDMESHEKELMQLIDPLTPEQIKDYFSKNGFVLKIEKAVQIDEKHSLYGYVFE